MHQSFVSGDRDAIASGLFPTYKQNICNDNKQDKVWV